MKKKIFKIFIIIFYLAIVATVLIWNILSPEGIIRLLFTDTINTIKVVCLTYIPLGILIFCAVKSNRYLINKRKINWKEYPDLEVCCGWLCFSSWFLFVTSIIFFIGFIIHEITFAPTVIFLLISIYSFWTYFYVVLAKRNSLYLFRSFLVNLSSFITIALFVRTPQFLVKGLKSLIIIGDYGELIFTIVFTLILSLSLTLCIKGLIFSFKLYVVELFKGGSLSYLQILAIVLIWVSIIVLAKTNISFLDITQSGFPPLNTAE